MPKTTPLSRAVILIPILSLAAGTSKTVAPNQIQGTLEGDAGANSAFCCYPGRRRDPHDGHQIAAAVHGGHYQYWRSHRLSRGGFQARFALISGVGPNT
jgi:hypothetical protein